MMHVFKYLVVKGVDTPLSLASHGDWAQLASLQVKAVIPFNVGTEIPHLMRTHVAIKLFIQGDKVRAPRRVTFAKRLCTVPFSGTYDQVLVARSRQRLICRP